MGGERTEGKGRREQEWRDKVRIKEWKRDKVLREIRVDFR